MELRSLRLSIKLPVEPARLYAAWLDSKQHAAFTGGGPAKVEPRVGGKHSAWGDYIQGKNLALEEGRRIVQTWRASEFTADDADSQLELLFEPDGKGRTLLTLVHTGLPASLAPSYEAGWADYYFKPMRKYFQLLKDKAQLKAKSAALKVSVKKAAAKAKKPAAKKTTTTKTTAKKPAAKTPAAKKPAAKTPAAKKPAAKKPAAKKPLAKKSVAKPAAKKPAAKKLVAKKTK